MKPASIRVETTSSPSILFVINSLTMGGAERVFATLVDQFADRRDASRVSVALLDSEPEVRRIERVSVTRFDCRGSLLLSVVRLFGLVRQQRPDLVVAFLSRANIAAITVMRLLGRPVIISERVDTTAHFASGRFSAVRRLMTRLAYPLANRVVAVSEGVAATLQRDFAVPAAKLSVVHNPVDLPGIRHQARVAPAMAVTRDDIVAVGRLMPNKNFGLAVDAWHDAGARGRLIILGEGPEREALQARAAALGLADRLVLPGFVENPYAIIARAGAFLLTSNAEGFPNALVEAMACGVPVVATDCASGPAEILRAEGHRPARGEFVTGDGGLLVPVGDVPAMARALEILRDEAASERLVAAAGARVKDFSIDAFVSRFSTEIDRVLDSCERVLR